MLKYDPEWMFAVLQDLMEFADEIELPETRDAIGDLIETSQIECKAKGVVLSTPAANIGTPVNANQPH